VKGEKSDKTLKLFQDYAGAENGTAREGLLEKVAARVISILVTPGAPNGNFQQLLEARAQYPTAFEATVIIVCQRLKFPTGLRSLLKLYHRTRDPSLREELLGIREKAFRDDQWDILQAFADEGSMQEFADLGEKQRKLK